jgi:hypothetical protein
MVKKLLKIIAYFLLTIIAIAIVWQGITMVVPYFHKLPSNYPVEDKHGNPYQNLFSNPEYHQYNANFHAHSNSWGFLTNGRKNSPEELYNVYTKMNFDIVCISDYQHINEFRDSCSDYIPVYEHGYNQPKAHQLSIGAREVTWYDCMFLQNFRVKQFTLNVMKERTELLVLNHPKKWGGYSDEELLALRNYDLFEVLNHYGNAEEAWDVVLSSGNIVWCLGDDDSHDVSKISEVGRKFTRVLAQNTDSKSILDALKHGQHYVVDMPVLENENFEEKAERIKQLPNITKLDFIGDSLLFSCDQKFDSLHIITNNSQIIGREYDSVAIGKTYVNLGYLRLKIFFPDGLTYYLNPILK